jgi:hypothetical protein
MTSRARNQGEVGRIKNSSEARGVRACYIESLAPGVKGPTSDAQQLEKTKTQNTFAFNTRIEGMLSDMIDLSKIRAQHIRGTAIATVTVEAQWIAN